MKMKMRFTTPCVIALMIAVPLCMADAVAQTGTPGTKQMRDVQRKAEQKARHSRSSSQAAAQHQKASGAAPASAP
jgi:hypothetical protein